MAREDVNIKVSANVAEAIRLWKAMEAGPQGMANELDQLGARGKKAAAGMGAEFDKIVGNWVGIAAAIAAAKKILDAFMQSQREHALRQAGASVGADQLSRELFQLTPGDRALSTIRNDMLQLAQTRRVAPMQSKEAIAALLGAGYSYDQAVTGGGADAVLRTLAATNATGKDVDTKGLVDALTGHLSATGQEKTQENLLKAGMAVQGMFAATKLEIEDLQNLAPRAKNIYDATGLANEQIPILSQFKDVTTADVGATSFHTATLRLLGAKSNRRSSRAIDELGLKPEDVDFQGESFFDVQNTLAAAFERAGPNAGRLKGTLFGNEGILAANVLFSREGAAQTRQRLGMAADPTAFNRAAAVTEGGLQAKAAAAESAEMQVHASESFTDPETARKLFFSDLEASGKSNAFYRTIGGAAFSTGMVLSGGDADIATGMAVDAVGGSEDWVNSVIQRSQADAVPVVRIELTDQNAVAIPHKAEVNKVGNNRAGKGR